MSMFNLTSGDDNMKCPHCGQQLGIEWDTEYGDPLLGEHDAICPDCGKQFAFIATITYDTWRRR
jgi:hypothetical protein